MAYFQFDFSLLSPRKNDVQQDRQFYQVFVSGVAFDSLVFINKKATAYAELLEQGKTLPKEWPDLLFEDYGNLLEEDEENELMVLIEANDLANLITRLKAIERRYESFYFEQVDDRLHSIDSAFVEAEDRTGFQMDYEVTQKLHRYHTDLKLTELVQSIRLLRENTYPTTLATFWNITYGPLEHHVLANSGEADDAEALWDNTLAKLTTKIEYGPFHPSGYQWYLKKALMSSFFQTIARRRWLDELRKNKRHRLAIFKVVETFTRSTPTLIEQIIDSKALEKALSQLGEPCASIIRLHWLEEKKLSEVAQILKLSHGHVRTIHRNCLDTLSQLVRKHFD
ncbi:hypothetical protein GCM10028807_23710 [Spirosoma daeguense]